MKRTVASLALALATAACGAPKAPSDARNVVVSLQRIDCAECGDAIVGDLRTRPGVYEATFDKQSAEVRVVASPSFDVFTTVKQLAAQEGFDSMLGAGKGRYLEGAKFPAGADVKTVAAGGADIPSLEGLTVKGKVTVVDFSAIWCSPCRKVDEHMAAMLHTRTDVAYRKLDIGDWGTPLAQRYLAGVAQLPYVVVYDTAGAKVKAIVGVDLVNLDAAIAKGSR